MAAADRIDIYSNALSHVTSASDPEVVKHVGEIYLSQMVGGLDSSEAASRLHHNHPEVALGLVETARNRDMLRQTRLS